MNDSVDLIGFYQIAKFQSNDSNDLRQRLFRKLEKIGLNQQSHEFIYSSQRVACRQAVPVLRSAFHRLSEIRYFGSFSSHKPFSISIKLFGICILGRPVQVTPIDIFTKEIT